MTGTPQDELKAGDRIHVRRHPLRDGSDGCLLGFITTADGAVKEWDQGSQSGIVGDQMMQ